MRISLNWCFIFFIFIISSSHAGEVVNYKKYQFEIDVPKKWRLNKNMFGIPVSIVSPLINGSRATIAITPTNRDDIKISEAKMRSQYQKYKDGRERWLKEYNGTSIRYFPYLLENWKNVSKVHSAGYKYSISGVVHEERTYFLYCNETLFHIKSLFNETNIKDGRKSLEKVVKSFKCM